MSENAPTRSLDDIDLAALRVSNVFVLHGTRVDVKWHHIRCHVNEKKFRFSGDAKHQRSKVKVCVCVGGGTWSDVAMGNRAVLVSQIFWFFPPEPNSSTLTTTDITRKAVMLTKFLLHSIMDSLINDINYWNTILSSKYCFQSYSRTT